MSAIDTTAPCTSTPTGFSLARAREKVSGWMPNLRATRDFSTGSVNVAFPSSAGHSLSRKLATRWGADWI